MGEAVVIEEKGIKGFVKEVGGEGAFKFIEAKVKEVEGGEGEED